MLTFKTMRFEVLESGSVYMQCTDAADGGSSSRHFMWSAQEWPQLLAAQGVGPGDPGGRVFVDGYHICDATWPGVLKFIDTDEIPAGQSAGKAQMRFYVMQIPDEALRYIAARLAAVRSYDVTVEERERWDRLFGQGKGKVVTWIDPRIEARFQRDVTAPSLQRCLEHWTRVASNTTYRYDQNATLRITRDGEGYFVEVITPQSTRSMHGGWVNHGSEDAPSWSSHT